MNLYEAAVVITTQGAEQAAAALGAVGAAGETSTAGVSALDAAIASLQAAFATLDAAVAAAKGSLGTADAALVGTGTAAEGAAGGLTALDGAMAALDGAIAVVAAAATTAEASLTGMGTAAAAAGAETATAGTEMVAAGAAADTAAGEVALLDGAFGALITELAPLIAAFASFETISKAIEVTGDLEASQERLVQAVKNAGHSWEEVGPTLQATIEKQHELSTFSRTELTEGLVRLVGLTRKVGEANEYLADAVGLATLKTISLESASNLVAKAINGNATMLNKQLGITGDAAHALEVLRQVTGGYAAVEAQSLQGQIKKLGQAWDEALIALGKTITQTGAWHDMITKLKEALQDAGPWIDSHRITIERVVTALADLLEVGLKLGAFAANFGAAVAGVADMLWALVSSVFNILADLIKGFEAGVVTMVAFVLDQLAKIVPGLQGISNKADEVAQHLRTVFSDNLDAGFGSFKAVVQKYRDQVDQLNIQDPLTFPGKKGADTGGKDLSLEGITKKPGKGAKDPTEEMISALQAQLNVGEQAIQMDATRASGLRQLQEAAANASLALAKMGQPPPGQEESQNQLQQRLALLQLVKEAEEQLKTASEQLDPGLATMLAHANQVLKDHAKDIATAAEADRVWGQAMGESIGLAMDEFNTLELHKKGIADLKDLERTLKEKLDDTSISLRTRLELMRQLTQVQQALGNSTTQLVIALQRQVQAAQQALEKDFLTLGQRVAHTLATSLSDGLAAAFSGKDPLQALGAAVLKGFGNILAQMGEQMVAAGIAMLPLLSALTNPFTAAPALIAVGVILTALGTALGGIMSGAGGGGGGARATYANTPTVTTVYQTSAGSQVSSLAAKPTINVGPVIGVNDPSAQRQIGKLVQNAVKRGIPTS